MSTLHKILATAIELFRQHGFKTITMDDIARSASISKKTLYQHFNNKKEVVSESVAWYKDQFFRSVTEIMNSSENAIDAMARLMHLLYENFRQLNPIALQELQQYYPEGYKRFHDKVIEQDIGAIRNNIEQGINEGLYRPQIDAELIARFRIETALMICQTNFFINGRDNLSYVNQEIMEHFLFGIMTEKGQKLYAQYKESYLKEAVL